MEDVIKAMTKKDTLHEGQGLVSAFELKRHASDLHVSEMATRIENKNLANIRIDDSILEKNLALILDRLSAVEVINICGRGRKCNRISSKSDTFGVSIPNISHR